MARDKISGTLKIWPGVAEEMVGAKAYFVRAGLFKDVDISLYSHVGANFGTGWGSGTGTGLRACEYTFTGRVGALGVAAVARAFGARRGRVDERRLELPAANTSGCSSARTT